MINFDKTHVVKGGTANGIAHKYMRITEKVKPEKKSLAAIAGYYKYIYVERVLNEWLHEALQI